MKVWRYYLPSIHGDKTSPRGDSWSIVFLDEGGCFAVISDYGNWSYRWSVEGTSEKDMRKFLIDCDYDYVARKIGRSCDNAVFDRDAAEENLKSQIIEARRDRRSVGDYSAVDAREDWDSLTNGGIDDQHGLMEWVRNSELALLSDAYSVYSAAVSTKRDFGLDHWTRVSFARLKDMIRAELKAEEQAA